MMFYLLVQKILLKDPFTVFFFFYFNYYKLTSDNNLVFSIEFSDFNAITIVFKVSTSF